MEELTGEVILSTLYLTPLTGSDLGFSCHCRTLFFCARGHDVLLCHHYLDGNILTSTGKTRLWWALISIWEANGPKYNTRWLPEDSIIGNVIVPPLAQGKESKMMSVSGLRSVRALSTSPKLDTDRPCLTALSSRQTSHLYLSRFLPNLFLSPWPLFMNLS